MIRTLLTSLSATVALSFAVVPASAQPTDGADQPADPPEVPAPTAEPVRPEPPARPGDVTGTDIFTPSVTVNPGMTPAAVAEPEREPIVATPMGMSLSFGAGVVGFRDGGFRDLADTGAAWEVRLAIGTRLPLALELAYIGSAQDLHVLGLDEDALLVSHGAEAGLRVNFANLSRYAPLGIQPYIAGGVAIRRYSIVNESFNTSSVAGDDTVYEFPIGVGLGLRAMRAMVDLRGSYRFSFYEDLITRDLEEAEAASAMDNWNLILTGGVEL